MTPKDTDAPLLTPDMLLRGYSIGVFPMSESRDDPEVFWVEPKRRGILPLDAFHISRSLARRLRNTPFRITYDVDFAGVVDACADRDETWINAPIAQVYCDLHAQGHAHSIEVWEGAALVGGVYGVTLGGAFFGESMFSRRTDASKIALAYLTDHLARAGFILFDTQFITPHLASLGAIEIDRYTYKARLAEAIVRRVSFADGGPVADAQGVMQRRAQTS